MVSIIIVTYNAARELLACLDSIQRFTAEIPHEVFVVDNASGDFTGDIVKREFPGVQLILNDQNLGFSQANNQALALAQGDFVLFLNPDTELGPDALKRMLIALEEESGCVAVGPRLVNPDGLVWRVAARRLPTLWTEACQLLWLDRLFPRSALLAQKYYGDWNRLSDRDVECLTGACMLCRTRQVRELGGFDESVPLFLDDIDLCRRLGDLGRLRYLSGSKILHRHNVSGNSQSPALLKRLSLQATYRYFIKHGGRAHATAFNFLVGGVGLATCGLAVVCGALGLRPRARKTWEKGRVLVDWAVRPKTRPYTLPRVCGVSLPP